MLLLKTARSTSGVCRAVVSRSARTRTNLAAEKPSVTLRVVTYQHDKASAIKHEGYPLRVRSFHALTSE
jgi:hypothetical protein